MTAKIPSAISITPSRACSCNSSQCTLRCPLVSYCRSPLGEIVAAAEYARAEKAEATRRAYRSDFEIYSGPGAPSARFSNDLSRNKYVKITVMTIETFVAGLSSQLRNSEYRL